MNWKYASCSDFFRKGKPWASPLCSPVSSVLPAGSLLTLAHSTAPTQSSFRLLQSPNQHAREAISNSFLPNSMASLTCAASQGSRWPLSHMDAVCLLWPHSTHEAHSWDTSAAAQWLRTAALHKCTYSFLCIYQLHCGNVFTLPPV